MSLRQRAASSSFPTIGKLSIETLRPLKIAGMCFGLRRRPSKSTSAPGIGFVTSKYSVVSLLCGRLRDEETLDRLITIINRTLAKPTELEPQIQQLVRRVAELEGRIKDGAERLLFCDKDLVGEMSEVLRSLKRQRRAAEEDLASLRSQSAQLGKPGWTRDQVVEKLASLATQLETVEPSELNRMLKTTIDRVQLKFRPVDGNKTRLSGGEIHISESTDSGMAGARFELTTSRL